MQQQPAQSYSGWYAKNGGEGNDFVGENVQTHLHLLSRVLIFFDCGVMIYFLRKFLMLNELVWLGSCSMNMPIYAALKHWRRHAAFFDSFLVKPSSFSPDNFGIKFSN